MTHKERLEAAFGFREADRVPIELSITPRAREHPAAEALVALIEEHADNLAGVASPDYGFFGFPVRERRRERIDHQPGRSDTYRTTVTCAAGTFEAVTYHPQGSTDYHWTKRYITTLDDLARLADTPRPPVVIDMDAYQASHRQAESRGLPCMALPHPLGNLARNATMENLYTWFHTEAELVHRFLKHANHWLATAVGQMCEAGMQGLFQVTAHEMLIPPWMGHRLFDEFVFPYDKQVNNIIHRHGGRLRAHCHGNCMDFLETFSAMGIDAIEPLEHPPAGDVDLVEAKRLVGDRMVLSGNIASERFVDTEPDAVRCQVRDAIRAAAAGGGFTLRTSGGGAGTCADMPEETLLRVLKNVETYLLAGLEYGQYPIHGG